MDPMDILKIKNRSEQDLFFQQLWEGLHYRLWLPIRESGTDLQDEASLCENLGSEQG